MTDRYRTFYEQVGDCYPEDELTYSSISGILRKKWIQQQIRKMPPGKLLDCGCNTGRLSARWQGGSVFGIDISLSVMKRGQRLFPDVNFIQGDLRDLSYIRSESIDNAIACEVLEHLNTPMTFLTGLRRILRRHGRVLLTVPGYTATPVQLIPLGIMRSYGIVHGTDGKLMLHKAYKPMELARIVAEAGFNVLSYGSFEKELRLWQKPLTFIEFIFTAFSERYFPNSRMNQLFTRTLERIKIDLYFVLDTLQFTTALRTIFSEGRRSFVIARK